MRHEPILPIVGPSGAGKSSFVAAGIVPRLRELDTWLVLTVRPGTNPFGTLSSIIEAGFRGDLGNTTSPSSFATAKPLEKKAEGIAPAIAVEPEPAPKGTDKPKEADPDATETATKQILPLKSNDNEVSPPSALKSDRGHNQTRRTVRILL